MPHISVCTDCHKLCEFASEEAANKPDPICRDCWRTRLEDAAREYDDEPGEPTPLVEKDDVPTYTVPDEHGPDLGGEG